MGFASNIQGMRININSQLGNEAKPISYSGMGFASLKLQQIKYGLEKKAGFLN